MKRAIFKMGQHCLISSQNGDNKYDVEFTPDWIADEQQWKLPVQASKKSFKEDGTTVVVGELNPAISKRFGEDEKSFKAQLERMVATNYAFIIDKGFDVKINGDTVKPRPTHLVFDKKAGGTKRPAIQPFIFKTKVELKCFWQLGSLDRFPRQTRSFSAASPNPGA